jgi:hypothetical protein
MLIQDLEAARVVNIQNQILNSLRGINSLKLVYYEIHKYILLIKNVFG